MCVASIAHAENEAAPPVAAPLATATGVDFIAQAQSIYQLVACAKNRTVPARFETAAVNAHCDKIDRLIDGFRTGWLAKAATFFGSIRPATLPDTVVYPFAGGDLVSAIVTYPNASQYNAISVETVGDPRAVDTVDGKALERTYMITEHNITNQFKVAHSRTDNLARAERDALPAELIFALIALRVYNLEPVRLNYFHVRADGTLEYLTREQLDAPQGQGDDNRFDSMELAFRPEGSGPTGRVQIFRHFSANLDNKHLADSPGLLKYLETNGKVAAMTKAASYLLWGDRFSTIRNYLLAHMVWMPSDSTGIPPHFAVAAGFTQETYGTFEGPFLEDATKGPDVEFATLWRSQPHRDAPMAYGYPDMHHHYHILITTPAEPATATTTGSAVAPVPGGTAQGPFGQSPPVEP